MRIVMIGSGYVGLVSRGLFRGLWPPRRLADTNPAKIDALRAGRVPIFEPGLDRLIAINVAAGRLSFTTDLTPAVAPQPTWSLSRLERRPAGVTGTPIWRFVHAAAREIAPAIRGFTVVATKSTVPVGTGDEVERIIRATNPRADVAIVSNPEFLREGAAIDDFKRPDRIVIGIEDERHRQVMEVLPSFVAEPVANPVHATPRSAN